MYRTSDPVLDERAGADDLLELRVVAFVELDHLAVVADGGAELRARERCAQVHDLSPLTCGALLGALAEEARQ